MDPRPSTPCDPWSCSVCTFSNHGSLSYCEMCGQPRLAAEPAELATPPGSPEQGCEFTTPRAAPPGPKEAPAPALEELLVREDPAPLEPPLGSEFLGEWRCVETTGLEEYLKAMGVGFLKRKMALAFKPKVIWSLTDQGALRSTAPSPLGERVEEHSPGQEVEDKDPNGKKWRRSSEWRGRTLVTTGRDLAGKQADIVTERWVREDGKLIQLCTQGAVSFQRVFNATPGSKPKLPVCAPSPTAADLSSAGQPSQSAELEPEEQAGLEESDGGEGGVNWDEVVSAAQLKLDEGSISRAEFDAIRGVAARGRQFEAGDAQISEAELRAIDRLEILDQAFDAASEQLAEGNISPVEYRMITELTTCSQALEAASERLSDGLISEEEYLAIEAVTKREISFIHNMLPTGRNVNL